DDALPGHHERGIALLRELEGILPDAGPHAGRQLLPCILEGIRARITSWPSGYEHQRAHEHGCRRLHGSRPPQEWSCVGIRTDILPPARRPQWETRRAREFPT